MSPQRWNHRNGAMRDESCLVTHIGYREVQIRLRGHVEHGYLDGAQRRLDVAVERWCSADVVFLPGTHLQDEIVGVRARNEIGAEMLNHLVEGLAESGCGAPQFLAPPLLREQPAGPHHAECRDSPCRLYRVI